MENRTFDDLVIGDTAQISQISTQRDIDLFAAVSGDRNPTHLDPAFAKAHPTHRVVLHGMWGAGLISAVLGTRLPGAGTVYLSQSLEFHGAVSIGDTITASVTVRAKSAQDSEVTLDCRCANQHGETVITGTAKVRAPTQKVRREMVALPYLRLSHRDGTRALLARAAGGAPSATAVVYPTDAATLEAALDAAAAGLIVPILIGPKALIYAAADAAGLKIGTLRVIDAADAADAAGQAVALARAGGVAMLMKGALHTDVLLHPVMSSTNGLRTARRISHVFLMDVPDYPRPLLLTDAAINVTPDLTAKVGIVQNAIDLAVRIGVTQPRVAILSAVETVSALLPSTLDAAALCKMADRGQITGGLLDGPLAFDNAINEAAAAQKGIVSAVAGRADILLAPDLESGNMLVKQLTFLAGAEAAGVVLGARIPIILTSRADGPSSRLASCALGAIMARAAV